MFAAAFRVRYITTCAKRHDEVEPQQRLDSIQLTNGTFLLIATAIQEGNMQHGSLIRSIRKHGPDVCGTTFSAKPKSVQLVIVLVQLVARLWQKYWTHDADATSFRRSDQQWRPRKTPTELLAL